MKKVFAMMLFFVIALCSYAGDKIKGELRTEINGFQWYNYKNKIVYLKDGRNLHEGIRLGTGHGVKSINFKVADKDDEGVFIFDMGYALNLYRPNGDLINWINTKQAITNIKLNFYVERIPITFLNPHRKEYFTRLTNQFGSYCLVSQSGNSIYYEGEYTVLDNFIIKHESTYNWTYVYLHDGKRIDRYRSIEKIGNSNIYRVRKNDSYTYTYITQVGEEVFKDKYSEITSCGSNYLKVKGNGTYGVLDFNGKEIIPTSRGYTYIGDYDSSKGTFAFTKKGVSGFCDAQGREISTTRIAPTADDIKANGGYASAVEMKNGSTKYYKVSKGGRYGLTDSEGKEVVPCEMEALESAGTGYLKYKINGFWGVMNYAGKIIIDTDRGYTSIGNFVTFTKRFPYTMTGYKGECDINGKQISKIKVETPKQEVAKQETTTSEKKETIIIEHKHDPIPVNVWVQCNICGGSGRCQTCGGSGIFTGPAGNKTLCSFGCGGSGKCSFCAGSGGHYEVEYK